ncbi:hypothetical protein B0H14DRAFT_3432075 [Mycena olivaceomarginata]|nr:hypothetical protein B0H14DRAFT_3432075 [Mycena olivaceomarginata]
MRPLLYLYFYLPLSPAPALSPSFSPPSPSLPSLPLPALSSYTSLTPLHSVLPEKSCAFLSFLDAQTGSAFYVDAVVRKLAPHAQELKVGWGKASPVPAQSDASRNVYLGGLDEGMMEEMLRDKLSWFGLIDQVVNTLPTDPAWAGKRVNYGKDCCG